MAWPSLAVLQLAQPANNHGERIGEETILTPWRFDVVQSSLPCEENDVQKDICDVLEYRRML